MDDKLQRQINEAAMADDLLRNEFLWKQFDHLVHEYIEGWKVMPAKDTDGREKLWVAVNVVGKVKQHLIQVLNDGKLAKHELERLTSKQG